MNDEDFFKMLVGRAQSTHTGYFAACHLIACWLDKDLREPLGQLVNGPIWDGDVMSKSARDKLINMGLAVRCCCKGEQGFTTGLYPAYTVWKKVQEIKGGAISE